MSRQNRKLTEMPEKDFADFIATASILNALCVPKDDALVFCDMLSNAFLWSDEIPDERPSRWWCIRPVWRCRTCRIIGAAPEYESWAAKGRELFPKWVGFLPERWLPSPELAEEFRRWEARTNEDLDRCFSDRT